MDRSPKGREIELVEGNPGDIISRGEKIESLGTQMLDSADTLERIKNEAVSDGSQKGKAIEKLKDSIGDSYETLREAGELYEPVGPVITAYGTALEGCKPTINNAVEDCESKWATYDSLPGDREGSTTPEAGGGFAGVGGYEARQPRGQGEGRGQRGQGAGLPGVARGRRGLRRWLRHLGGGLRHRGATASATRWRARSRTASGRA